MAALTSNGRVLTWGNPDSGKLGHLKKELTAEEVASKKAEYKKRGYQPKNYADQGEQLDFVYGGLEASKVTQVQCGLSHTVALTADGHVYSWGEGKLGALGHGDWQAQDQPKKVEGLEGVVAVQVGSAFTVALDK